MIRLYITVVCVTLSFAVAAAMGEEPSPGERLKLVAEIDKLLDKQLELRKKGRYADAVATCENAVALARRIHAAPHPQLGECLTALANTEEKVGNHAKALALAEEAFAVFTKLHSGDHTDVARAFNVLGSTQLSLGRFEQAAASFESALSMRRRLYPAARFPEGHTEISTSLTNLAVVNMRMGRRRLATEQFEEALAMDRRLFSEKTHPDGHVDLAQTLRNVGKHYDEIGRPDRALPLFEQAVAIFRKLYPPRTHPIGHPHLVAALSDMGFLLDRLTRQAEAIPFFDEALQMARKVYPPDEYPDGHPDLINVLDNYGLQLLNMRQTEKALPMLEEALAIARKYYGPRRFPNGHSELALSFNNMAAVYHQLKRYKDAARVSKQSVEVWEKVYPAARFPKGSPQLALTLSNYAIFTMLAGEPDAAVPLFDRALKMCRDVLPANHPVLSACVNNLGYLHKSAGRFDQALRYYEEAQAINRRLFPPDRFPDGHSQMILTANNIGILWQAKGQPENAFPLHLEALDWQSKQLVRACETAAEADAMDIVFSQPPSLDCLMQSTQTLRDQDERVYAAVWRTKSAASRVLALRHTAARAAAAPDARRKLQELYAVRAELARAVSAPAANAADRDRKLADLTERRDRLERDLTRALPELTAQRELDRLAPNDLVKSLPADAAFVDIVHWRRSVSRGPAAHESVFSAFVLMPGKPIHRIELGLQAPIQEALNAWIRSIERQQPETSASRLRELVWKPIEALLPKEATTLFLSPDGLLSRVPWAALPDRTGNSVLLTQFEGGIAVVPHGPFLLEQFRRPPATTANDRQLLVLGDIHYTPKSAVVREGEPYPTLIGTKAELNAVLAVAGDRSAVRLDGEAATVSALIKHLPASNFAHIATHGYFAGNELAAERKRIDARVRAWHMGSTPTRLGLGARSPLAYSGLVLAGANRPTPNDNGILTSETIVGLPLENMRLAVLSACETGLGDVFSGEGVFGLTRAFHLAGCPNVVASLWKVSDTATAALMAKFYHELWVNKKQPLAALREAQLFIYHHPELIPDALGERGAPKRAEALAVKTGEPGASATGVKKRADTKLWAAFVLSGVGK